MTKKDNPDYWEPGDVVLFTKLHYDKARFVRDEERRSGDRREFIKYYEIEGKERPCLIIRSDFRGSFLVWYTTCVNKDGYIELSEVPNLRGRSYLPMKSSEIRWIHKKLSGKFIGSQYLPAFTDILDKHDKLILKKGSIDP